ncbi:MAG: ATP synthase F1 subunit delta [Cytophagales bacterium]|nr:ATP synthase F1 subunit delta [Cytophagales bacterium]
MAVSSRVALRYAKSLLDLAQEKNSLEEVKSDLVSFIEAIDASSELADALNSPIIENKTKARILNSLFKGKVSDLTLSFFQLTSDKKREDAIYTIAKQFLALYNEVKGIKNVAVYSATPLTDSVKQNLTASIKNALAKEVVLNEHIDESLIGGFVLRIDDKQIDNSIKSHLNQIRNKFSQVS